MPIRIRRAGLTDIPTLIRYRRRMFHEMGNTDEPALERMCATAQQYFERALPAGGYVGWLAETSEGEVIACGGIVIFDWPGSPWDSRPQRAVIINVYTEPAHRRRGIARQLMENMLEWCRAEGFAGVALHASDEGRSLYESLGFVPTNEMRLGWKP